MINGGVLILLSGYGRQGRILIPLAQEVSGLGIWRSRCLVPGGLVSFLELFLIVPLPDSFERRRISVRQI